MYHFIDTYSEKSYYYFENIYMERYNVKIVNLSECLNKSGMRAEKDQVFFNIRISSYWMKGKQKFDKI